MWRYKYIDWKVVSTWEDLGQKDKLLSLAKRVSRSSLVSGLIPRRCPLCGQPTCEFHFHHWEGDLWDALVSGDYRRICPGCNVQLGVFFRGDYPSWVDQYKRLIVYLKDLWPSFESSEGWWSRMVWKELESYDWEDKTFEGYEKLLIVLGLLD